MAIYLFILLLPFLDRIRGSDTGLIDRNLAKLSMASVVTLSIVDLSNVVLVPIFVLLYLIGTSIGWGACVGGGLLRLSADQYERSVNIDKQTGTLEFYIIGPLRRSWLGCLVVRGFIWGILPSVSLIYFEQYAAAAVLTIAYTVAMPGGVLLANYLEDANKTRYLRKISMAITKEADKWGDQELLRGAIVAGIILITNVLGVL